MKPTLRAEYLRLLSTFAAASFYILMRVQPGLADCFHQRDDITQAVVSHLGSLWPDFQFLQADIGATAPPINRQFDVVTAFEVLYYVKDIPKMLETMSRVGRACVVSYCGPAVSCFERPMRKMEVAGRATFAFGDATWQVAWWRPGG